MRKIYYITGVSGTGKSTISKELNKRGILSIDQDSKEYGLCSWKNNKTMENASFEYGIGKEFLDMNDWYCDIEKLKKLLTQDENIIFVCGVSANQNEYINLFDKVFLLKCQTGELIKRIDKREDHQFGKHLSEKEHILNYCDKFEKNLINKGAILINSDKPVSIAVEEILKNISYY